jgi:hypothetical protein
VWRLTRHTNASERSRIVQTGSVVVARMGFAFVHVGLASWSGEALGAVAGEAAGGVDADAVVLAGGTCKIKFKKSLEYYLILQRMSR